MVTLRDQIRAAACISWVGVLGLGLYISTLVEASSHQPESTRAFDSGPLKSGGARAVPPSGGDLRRPTAGKPEKRAGLTPRKDAGFAEYGPVSMRSVGSAQPATKASEDYSAGSVERTQRGVRHVPLPVVSRQSVSLKEAGRGSYQPYTVTGYSHGCILPKFGPEPPPQPMASGEWPVAGVHVAADPSLAFGTVLEVVYRGLPSRLIVGDRGRAIRGRRLDLFLRSCEEAKAWGRRTAYVREIGASE